MAGSTVVIVQNRLKQISIPSVKLTQVVFDEWDLLRGEIEEIVGSIVLSGNYSAAVSWFDGTNEESTSAKQGVLQVGCAQTQHFFNTNS